MTNNLFIQDSFLCIIRNNSEFSFLKKSNMYKSVFFFLLLFTTTCSVVCAQNPNKEARKYLEEGKILVDAGYYNKALDQYLQAVKLMPGDPGVNYSVAYCYLNIFEYGKSLPFLIKAKNGKIEDPMMDLYLGMAYHGNNKFDEALASLTTFKATLRSSDKELMTQTDRYIVYCNNAKKLIVSPVEMTITNMGASVNSKYPDYNPAISVDEATIIFTSRRDNSTGALKSEIDDHYFEDIYISNKNEKGEWNSAKHISALINTASHDACVGISAEGQTMIVYKTDNGGDLFYSRLEGAEWGAPISFGKSINTIDWEACGNFSADGNNLFFVSNKKGGYGGTDIYVSRKNADGTWAAATNMGPDINTSADEFSPYLHADGKTFYFSSQAHTSMGGFDIFQATINTATPIMTIVEKPVNMGYPINTVDDEIYFVWSADNKRAYFSSAREGGLGDKDLYILKRPEAKAELVMLKGTITDCFTKKAISAVIDVNDIETGKPIGKYTSNSATGKYVVILPAGKNYAVNVEAKGYLFYSKNINIPKMQDFKEIDDLLCLELINVGTTIVLNNVFFDVDKATLRNESETELGKLYDILLKNPHIKIEVDGHTDSDGDAEHNMKLSDSRAHAVKDYLISKGIAADRIMYKGFGETMPVVDNLTPENKQLNRRTEIKILEN